MKLPMSRGAGVYALSYEAAELQLCDRSAHRVFVLVRVPSAKTDGAGFVTEAVRLTAGSPRRPALHMFSHTFTTISQTDKMRNSDKHFFFTSGDAKKKTES